MSERTSRQFGNLVAGLACLIVPAGCGGSPDHGPDGGATQNATAALQSQMTSIGDAFLPSSLDFDSESSKRRSGRANQDVVGAAQMGNPCEGYDLFGCQPVLLRLYLSVSHRLFAQSTQIVGQVGSHLGNVADGDTGEQAIGDGSTVYYDKTDSTHYSILRKDAAGTSRTYITVSGQATTLQVAGPGGGNGPSDIQIRLNFTDDDTWTLEFLGVAAPCNNDDVRAPERFRIAISRDGAVWTGKAMLYMPRWMDQNPTCNTTPTDETSMLLYTDFVADDLAAKASIYMLQRDQVSLADIENFGMDQICTNYPSICGQSPPSLSEYQNPFCNAASTDVAVWSDDCTSVSTTVGAAPFGLASDWTTPNALYQETFALPASL